MIRWYRAARRDVPWRVKSGLPEAYHVLLSEFMLQQTQVATVVPYFNRVLSRYPTPAQLASADEQDVLRLWQGLGYYSRARNLHRAAQVIVREHDGIVPRTVQQLLKLPGVGRYTAGAIASLAYGTRTPILDGNVQRVLCRLQAVQDDPRDAKVRAHLWRLAESMLPAKGVADYNSALMELGATICRPRNPQCPVCPVRRQCQAAAQGIADEIPPAKKAQPRPVERRWVYCIEHAGEWLIQQRPAKGRWASLWQFPTVVAPSGRLRQDAIAAVCPIRIRALRRLGEVRHDLTHRRYQFIALRAEAVQRVTPAGLRWVAAARVHEYPMSRPQLMIAELAMQATA